MRLFMLPLAVLMLAGPFSSLAVAQPATQEPAPTSDAPPSPGSAFDANKPAPPAPGDHKAMDFDFFAGEGTAANQADGAAQRDSSEVSAKAARRRWMLKVHQALGITTWALMAATVTVGQLNYNQLYGDGGGRTKWQGPHKILIASTAVAFSATGAFAMLAPNPYSRPLKLDTSLIHRIAVAGATLGMITEIILGVVTSRRADAGNPRSLGTLARAHQIVGYSTFGMLTVAGTVWVF